MSSNERKLLRENRRLRQLADAWKREAIDMVVTQELTKYVHLHESTPCTYKANNSEVA